MIKFPFKEWAENYMKTDIQQKSEIGRAHV